MSAGFLQRIPILRRLLRSADGRSLRHRFLDGIPEGFFHNVGWQYGGTAAASVIGFLYTLLVAKALGVGQFGLMALGLGFAAIVSQFANVRVREMIIRYATKFQQEGDLPRVLATAKLSLLLDAACGTVGLALLFALAPWAAAHLVRDRLGFAVVALAGLAFIFQNVANDTALGLMRLLSKFKTLALVEVAAAALKLIAALVVVRVLNGGVLGVLAALLFVSLAANFSVLAMALGYLRREIPLRSHAPLSLLRPYRKEISRFLLHNYLSSLASFAGGDLDINLLGFFTTKEAVGVYKVARSFIITLWQLSDAAFLVVYPELARLWARSDFAGLKRFVKRLSLIMGGSGVLLYAAAFFLVPWVVHAFMRSEFAEAGLLFRCMGWGIILWSPMIWAGPLLVAAGRTDLTLRTSLASSVTMLLLYSAAIPLLGALGAALVYAVNHAVFVTFALWHARRAGLLLPAAVPSPKCTRS